LAEDKHEIVAAERIVRVFDRSISLDEALSRFKNLEEDKWPYARACMLFEGAGACRTCNHELKQDLRVALLCSAIEAVNEAKSYVVFKDWLIANKLKDLARKSTQFVRKILNNAYQEYIETEPYREGAFHNFRKFLFDNCPVEIREGPIEIYQREESVFTRRATFDECISYMYARFRSLFLHRGLGRASISTPEGLEEATLIGAPLLDLYRGKAYSVELTLVVEWFESVVKESLWAYLSRA